ncbi:MAG TPA: PqqD family protein [Pyrinomonadaceae bacterium]|nr:PqqD family protein [Pyrinomonadaceae bacterium]
MTNKMKPVARQSDLVVQELNGEILIYDLRSNKAFCLNETSARIWQACNGNNTVSDISTLLGSEDLAWLALNDLKKEKLVEHELPTPAKFDGMSRRQVVKHIGLSSMLALPVIAGMVAPAAAQAASCLANDANCTASAQCCSMCCKNVSPSINQCKPGGGACLP